MRSATEILFRLRQELTNAVLWLRPPASPPVSSSMHLPDPHDVAAALRGTPFAQQVQETARAIRDHRFPLLGFTLDAGPSIQWRRDSINQKETGTDYFRLIPYLDPQRAGDHKIIWELNRHQHLVLLAQNWLLTGDGSSLKELFSELESWEDANPFQCGINWASALEVAFRALSWLWIYHIAGGEMPGGLRSRFLDTLFRHGRHIETNLSFYFSPNTHLLGEAVALNALGHLFSEFRDLGAQVAADQMNKQVRDDGSHFEQSTYYHVYALDMFLFHAIVEDVSPAYLAKLEQMSGYLHTILGPQRKLPFLGDDDGGRFFHPFGPRDQFGRATMATCSVFLNRPEWLESPHDLHEQAAWWLGPQVLNSKRAPLTCASHLFDHAGVAVMTAGDRHIVIDAGPFGPWGSGHSHSDTLSLVVRAGDREILIDAGTFTYTGEERNWFRGSIAHNTIRIDAADQAMPVDLFRWTDQPATRIHAWESTAAYDYLDAECSYRGFTHRRRVRYVKPDGIHITDEISGPPGEHEIEQFWHPASPESERCLVLDGEAGHIEGWRSGAYGEKHTSPLLRVYRKCELPLKLETRILLK